MEERRQQLEKDLKDIRRMIDEQAEEIRQQKKDMMRAQLKSAAAN
jgi:hypothetical protein